MPFNQVKSCLVSDFTSVCEKWGKMREGMESIIVRSLKMRKLMYNDCPVQYQ